MHITHAHDTETAINKAVFIFGETNNVINWKYIKDSETGYVAINDASGLYIVTLKAKKNNNDYVITIKSESESENYDCPMELLKITDPANKKNNQWRIATKEYHRLVKLAKRKIQRKRNTIIACKGDFLQTEFVSDYTVKYGTMYRFVERDGNQYKLHNLQNDKIEIVNARYFNQMKLGQP